MQKHRWFFGTLNDPTGAISAPPFWRSARRILKKNLPPRRNFYPRSIRNSARRCSRTACRRFPYLTADEMAYLTALEAALANRRDASTPISIAFRCRKTRFRKPRRGAVCRL